MKKIMGFTLIELMIVVAVIGVLAAIAIPNYNEYVTRSRITEAISALSDARVRMEQYFQDNRCYNGNPIGNCNTASAACAFTLPATRNFTYACVAANTGQSYTWTATGTGAMTGFSYTVNQANARTSAIVAGAAWPAAAANCWITGKTGC